MIPSGSSFSLHFSAPFPRCWLPPRGGRNGCRSPRVSSSQDPGQWERASSSIPSKSLHASLCPPLNTSIVMARGMGCPWEARLRWHATPKALGGSTPLKSQIHETDWWLSRGTIRYGHQRNRCVWQPPPLCGLVSQSRP